MNPRSLSINELVQYGFAKELLRRAQAGECYFGETENEVMSEAFDHGYNTAIEHHEDYAQNVRDMLGGELWGQLFTEEELDWLFDDVMGTSWATAPTGGRV